jgi:hypothetical protein
MIFKRPGFRRLLELRRIDGFDSSNSLKIKKVKNGMTIAIDRVPVMYRLLENSGQPTKKQAPGKSIRLERPLSRETGRGSMR